MSRYNGWSGDSSRAYGQYPQQHGDWGRQNYGRGRYSDGYRNDGYDRGYRQGRSSGGGGGGGGGYGRAYGDRSRDTAEVNPTVARLNRVKRSLLDLGEKDGFHAPSELYTFAQRLVEDVAAHEKADSMVFSTFRTMVTEQPHKLPLTAALLATLVRAPPAPATSTSGADGPSEPLGSAILADYFQAFRSFLDARLWRNVRLSLRFFALLASLQVITRDSLYKVLRAFTAVLEEPAVTVGRADRAADCVVDAVIFAGHLLCKDPEEDKAQLDVLVDKVSEYAAGRKVSDDLILPWTDAAPLTTESFESRVAALISYKEASYPAAPFLPSPAELAPPAIAADASGTGSDLPDVLVPPEEEEQRTMIGRGIAFAKLNDAAAITAAAEGEANQARTRLMTADEAQLQRLGSGPSGRLVHGRWMSETAPKTTSPSSVIVRGTVDDIIDIYEPNRRDAAKVLVDLAKWFHKGTFSKSDESKGLTGAVPLDWASVHPCFANAAGSWIWDDILVECTLSNAFLLPQAPYPEIYYASLLREIVTIQPQSIAPAIGKSLRRLYAAFDSGNVECEVIKRASDWFSAHLSNFNYGWAWKEWIPDMQSPVDQPRRAFVTRVIEHCVRLAYYDRIKSALPAELQEAGLPSREPGPNFVLGQADHPQHGMAQELMKAFRAKASADVIMATLESFRRDLTDPEDVTMSTIDSKTVGSEAQAQAVVRDIAMQSLLEVGSRSFSHFLNVVERYHALLRQLSTSPAMRVHILGSVARFWQFAPQWILMITDKLLQYRIVEPSDVVRFVFHPEESVLRAQGEGEEARDWSNHIWWELLQMTIEKINGRVSQLQSRLDTMAEQQIETDERVDAAAAGEAEAPASAIADVAAPTSFPVSAIEVVKKEAPVGSTKDTIQDRKQALEAVLSEQRKVFADVLKGLNSTLSESTGDEGDWQRFWVLGWTKQFLRRFHMDVVKTRESISAAAGALAPEIGRLLDACTSMQLE